MHKQLRQTKTGRLTIGNLQDGIRETKPKAVPTKEPDTLNSSPTNGVGILEGLNDIGKGLTLLTEDRLNIRRSHEDKVIVSVRKPLCSPQLNLLSTIEDHIETEGE